MRVLLTIDGSSYSDLTTMMLESLQLSPQNEVIVMTVVPEQAFLGEITIDKFRSNVQANKKVKEEEAHNLLNGPVKLLSNSGLKVERLVCWGNPAQVISRVADEKSASLIIMGAKGLTNYPAYRLGSVSQTLIKHARTNVLLVRKQNIRTNQDIQQNETKTAINKILFATDGSKYADMASQFLLDLPLPKQSHIIVATVTTGLSNLQRMSSFYTEAEQELFADLQVDEENEAQKIIARNIKQFNTKGYGTSSMILKGEVGESILKTASQYDPDMITLGSRGLSGIDKYIDSFFLGSVSERIARHAKCSYSEIAKYITSDYNRVMSRGLCEITLD